MAPELEFDYKHVSLQLLAHKSRGWAWTRAFLGVPSEELHVCGDHSCIGLTEKLCELTGKEFQQHSYERLTPLNVDMNGLGPEGYAGLKPGDCVVAFSKRDLYSIRRQIVQATGAPLLLVFAPPSLQIDAEAVSALLFLAIVEVLPVC
jgi:ATP-dependent RNA helicase SUPV3L1/SUV3